MGLLTANATDTAVRPQPFWNLQTPRAGILQPSSALMKTLRGILPQPSLMKTHRGIVNRKQRYCTGLQPLLLLPVLAYFMLLQLLMLSALFHLLPCCLLLRLLFLGLALLHISCAPFCCARVAILSMFPLAA